MTGMPIFRIVWSDDQLEKRKLNVTETGIQLLTPIVKEVPKYGQWINHRYVLERLVIVPEINKEELMDKKLSYEPLWVFQNGSEEAVAPTLWGCKFIIDAVYAATGKKSLRKYVDEEAQKSEELREARINKLQEELFGDESGLMGTTVTGETVIVPQNFKES
jgi:hypothetical protein